MDEQRKRIEKTASNILQKYNDDSNLCVDAIKIARKMGFAVCEADFYDEIISFVASSKEKMNYSGVISDKIICISRELSWVKKREAVAAHESDSHPSVRSIEKDQQGRGSCRKMHRGDKCTLRQHSFAERACKESARFGKNAEKCVCCRVRSDSVQLSAVYQDEACSLRHEGAPGNAAQGDRRFGRIQ